MPVKCENVKKYAPGKLQEFDPVGSHIPDDGFFGDKTSVLNSFGDQVHMDIPAGIGHGWVETTRLNRGLMIGLCDYQLDHAVEGGYANDSAPCDQGAALGFCLSLMPLAALV